MLTKSEKYFCDAEAVREDGPTYTRKAGGYTQHSKQGASRFGGKGGFGDSDVTTTGRNKRDVWSIATHAFSAAHFATFPPKLVDPCIKAGTSDKGCCPECGSPWARVVGRTDRPQRSAKGSYFDKGKTGARDGGDRTQPGERFESSTLGWRPTCSCDAGEPEPCIVFDPFMGAGTTALVAWQNHRRYIGCELKPEYAAMAEKRINAARNGTALFDSLD